MKICLAIFLLAAIVFNAATAAVDFKADASDGAQVPIRTEEDAEATESTLLTTNGEKSEQKKDKLEKQDDEEGHEKEENEENEDEEDEKDEEESDEEDSDEEDSEESDGKGISKKKVTKDESEEDNEKADVFKVPSAVLPRSRLDDTSVATQSYKPVDASPSGYRTLHPEFFYGLAKSLHQNAEVHSPKFDVTEISTPKSSTQFPIWSRPVDSTRRLDDAGPIFRSTKIHQTEERKVPHSKWFFNTPNKKHSDDTSTKKETSKPFVPEIPMSKAAFVQNPIWPIIDTRPLVRESYNPAISRSDRGNSHPKWFFNAPSRTHDEFSRKENSQPVDIYTPVRQSAAVQAQRWSKPAIPSAAPPIVSQPVYKDTSNSQPSTRKVYPRWFFNIKN